MLKYLFVNCALLIGNVLAQQFSLIGSAYEAGNPCANGILSMARLIGGPPSKENYWNGTLRLDDTYKNLPEARVTLKLTAPASVTLDEEDGRLLTTKEAFHITFYKKDDGTYNAKFVVRGRPKGDFPNLKELQLNNADVCPNMTTWKPSLLGAGNVGNVDLEDDAVDSGPLSKCGRRIIQHEGLITNGYPTQEGEWPWHVGIFHIDSKGSQYRCGGTLISSKAVITAGHCVIDNTQFIVPERVLVRLGQHNRLFANSHTQEHRIFRVIPHPDFNINDLSNDIALLKLSTEVAFTDYIQPACLWEQSDNNLNDVINEEGNVVGWGFNQKDELSEVLSQGKMPIVSRTTCLKSNRPFFLNYLSDFNYCAGFRNGTSVCNGDSGGGMFFQRGGVYRLRGLVSLSVAREDRNLCNPRHYVIFTDCAKYVGWIEDNLADENAKPWGIVA